MSAFSRNGDVLPADKVAADKVAAKALRDVCQRYLQDKANVADVNEMIAAWAELTAPTDHGCLHFSASGKRCERIFGHPGKHYP